MRTDQLSEFGVILLFIVGAVVFTLLVLAVAKFIRPNRPNPEKLAPYECGEEAVGSSWTNFNVRFYVIALMFVLFEVEILFLFPWATVFGKEQFIRETNGLWGWYAIIEVGIFVFLLALGLVYAWVKGNLDWIKSEPMPETFESKVPKNLYDEINTKYSKPRLQDSLEINKQ